jgi:RNA polymerase sigma factor (sigma-70 family)
VAAKSTENHDRARADESPTVFADTLPASPASTTAPPERWTIDAVIASNTQPGIDPAHAAALLVAVQRGRDGAFGELVRMCEPLVRRHAQRYAWRRNDVDDVVQEVWVRLLLKADQIREPRTLIAWLHVVTRRAASQLGHREARLLPAAISDDHPSVSSTEDDALGRLDRDQVTRGVRQALDRLEAHDRRLLLLLHREDRPGYGEISAQVRRPVGSLGPSRRRLLDRLRNDRHISRLRTLPAAS